MNVPQKMVSAKEVSKHNDRESCWIIVHGWLLFPESRQTQLLNLVLMAGAVYDVTEFLDGAFFCSSRSIVFSIYSSQSIPVSSPIRLSDALNYLNLKFD